MYGFVDPENKEDINIFLRMKLKKSDPIRQIKMDILGEKQIELQLTKVPDPDTLSILRIALFDDMDNLTRFKTLREEFEIYSGTLPPFSTRNEINVMR